MMLTCPLTQNRIKLTSTHLVIKGDNYDPNNIVRILMGVYNHYKSSDQLRDFINAILVYYRFRVYIAYRLTPEPVPVEIWATNYAHAHRLSKQYNLCLDEPPLYFPRGYSWSA